MTREEKADHDIRSAWLDWIRENCPREHGSSSPCSRCLVAFVLAQRAEARREGIKAAAAEVTREADDEEAFTAHFDSDAKGPSQQQMSLARVLGRLEALLVDALAAAPAASVAYARCAACDGTGRMTAPGMKGTKGGG